MAAIVQLTLGLVLNWLASSLCITLWMGLAICKRQRAWSRHRKLSFLINIGSNLSVSVNMCITLQAWDMPSTGALTGACGDRNT
ncbi:hypothetical protein DER46DRAFT_602064 [Fusarium sp. MPI-SDFR-AT-0072]|nr:hypothetical protein DER46DRAFT_602064 [Fusarium sp. MPI-SDFR-AT-0072]